MTTIRERFDAVDEVQKSSADPFSQAETAAFHGRKIVEGIAFGCLVAIENGLKVVPQDAKGQWNAEAIFTRLKSKGLSVLPSPSRIRDVTPAERAEKKVKFAIEGMPERRLTHDELINLYRSLHPWIHEANPYVHAARASFYAKNADALWACLSKLRQFVERHFITIHGAAFLCVLWDSQDGQTKVGALSKVAA